jgi:hypothetical protein
MSPVSDSICNDLSSDADSVTDRVVSDSENPENNYKKAAKKLKEMQLNIDMIKNRFKVLHSQ